MACTEKSVHLILSEGKYLEIIMLCLRDLKIEKSFVQISKPMTVSKRENSNL